MAKTLAEQLTSVQAAIEAIETGEQSFTIEEATFTKANLSTLYAREERLLKKIAREENKGRSIAHF
ncbi:MAG: hypothetical protein JXA04_01245 [Gammaproteobacteria bacterium]|nr:hypothetical protein [Gammaproteobacteria bacterium]